MMVLFVKVHLQPLRFYLGWKLCCWPKHLRHSDQSRPGVVSRLVADKLQKNFLFFLLFFSRFQHSIGCVLCVHAISIISTPMPIKTHTPQSDGQIKLARLNHIYYSCSNWRKTQIPRLSFYSIWYFMCTNLLPEHR